MDIDHEDALIPLVLKAALQIKRAWAFMKRPYELDEVLSEHSPHIKTISRTTNSQWW